MQNFFLRLKSWQVFAGIFILPGITMVLTTTCLPQQLTWTKLMLLAISGLLTMIFWQGWVWSCVRFCCAHKPAGLKMSLKPFAAYTIFIIGFWVIMCFYGAGLPEKFLPGMKEESSETMLLAGFFAWLSCILLQAMFFAKLLVSLELGREASFREYIFDSLTIMFFANAALNIHPRIRNLYSHHFHT